MPVTSPLFRDLLPPAIDLIDRYARYDWREQCAAAYGFVERPEQRARARDHAGRPQPASSHPCCGAWTGPAWAPRSSAACRSSTTGWCTNASTCRCATGWARAANKWVLKRVAERYLPAGLVERKKMGFPIPLADYMRPLASTDFFAGGFCEEELGLKRHGIERLLDGWERWVYAFFGLVTLEIWGRLHFRNQSVELIEEQIRLQEHARQGAPLVACGQAPFRTKTTRGRSSANAADPILPQHGQTSRRACR